MRYLVYKISRCRVKDKRLLRIWGYSCFLRRRRRRGNRRGNLVRGGMLLIRSRRRSLLWRELNRLSRLRVGEGRRLNSRIRFGGILHRSKDRVLLLKRSREHILGNDQLLGSLRLHLLPSLRKHILLLRFRGHRRLFRKLQRWSGAIATLLIIR